MQQCKVCLTHRSSAGDVEQHARHQQLPGVFIQVLLNEPIGADRRVPQGLAGVRTPLQECPGFSGWLLARPPSLLFDLVPWCFHCLWSLSACSHKDRHAKLQLLTECSESFPDICLMTSCEYVVFLTRQLYVVTFPLRFGDSRDFISCIVECRCIWSLWDRVLNLLRKACLHFNANRASKDSYLPCMPCKQDRQRTLINFCGDGPEAVSLGSETRKAGNSHTVELC